MATRQPHQLSGGQQQRGGAGPRHGAPSAPDAARRAVLAPSTPGLRDQLRKATADILKAAGIATVLVTHDREEAMGFADQLVVLRDGRLAAGRPAARPLPRPADEAVASFLGQTIVLDADIRAGRTHSILGPISLRSEQQPPDGQARILLRPEQLQLAPAGSAEWTLRALERVGGRAAITIVHGSGPELSFESAQHDLPDPGSKVAVSVTGTAWALIALADPSRHSKALRLGQGLHIIPGAGEPAELTRFELRTRRLFPGAPMRRTPGTFLWRLFMSVQIASVHGKSIAAKMAASASMTATA